MDKSKKAANEEDELSREPRTRSFRDEDYNNRRVFLNSYPLNNNNNNNNKNKYLKNSKRIKRMMKSVVRWSEGKGMVLTRRFSTNNRLLGTTLRIHSTASCVPIRPFTYPA